MNQKQRQSFLVAMAVAGVVYCILSFVAIRNSGLPHIGWQVSVWLSGAIVAQFFGKWAFGALFRSGVVSAGQALSHRSAFRAALVGGGVARLIPAGGAITPVAMAWTVSDEATNTGSAAVRATMLNYGAILVAAGISVLAIVPRGTALVAGLGLFPVGGVLLIGGLALFVLAQRVTVLLRFVPLRWRSRVAEVAVNQPLDLNSVKWLIARVGAEATALYLSFRAFDVPVTLQEAIAAFGISQIVGGLPGTPGGLGYAEAGLVGTLAVFGFPASQVIGPALVYRVVSYWLPALAGSWVGGNRFMRASVATP